MTDFKLTEQDGELLVKFARKVATEFLTTGKKIELDKEFENRFSFNAGIFVLSLN